MALTIDELNIQIEAESKNATTAIDTLIGRLEDLQGKLNGLGSSGKSAANGIKSVGDSIKKTGDNAKNAEKGLKGFVLQVANGEKPMKKFTDQLSNKIQKFRTLYGAFKSLANIAAGWFTESNNYIETLNLFNVTMGDGATAAYEYAENVQKLVGIDIAEWMQYQGVFKNLTAGFGVASEDANKMSQNLTQLSYDMASFFNTDVETAFDKLSSAMSGQVKGLREFGIDTTVASLQEYALAKGIDKSVRSMTQAEKSMLRYNYIMEKSIIMQGDMARTLVTPANSLRILSAQFTQLKRALGNIISVVAVKFIPYVQAMVEILTEAATALANFFGFELPKIDYSGLGGSFEDDEDALDGVSDKVKEIKKQLMGFDELNIISSPDSDSSSGDSASGGSLNMDLLEYDFLKGLDTGKLDEIKQKMKDIMGYIPTIAAGLGAWKLTRFIADLLFANTKANTLKEAIKLLGQKLTLTAGVTLAITGIVLETKGIISAIKEGLSGVNFTEILGGGGMIVAGGALIGKFFGSSLLGAAIGAIVAGIPMFVTGIYDAIMNGLNWLNSILIPAGATLTGAGIGAIIGMLGGPIGAGIGALIGLAVGLVTDLVLLIVQNWDSITGWCSQACKDIGNFFVGLWENIKSVWNTVAAWFDTTVIQPIVNFFVNLWNGAVSLATDCWEGIKKTWNTVTTWFDANIIQPIANFFVGLWKGISLAASTCWDAIVTFFTPAVEWFSQLFGSVWQTISDIFYNIGVIISGCWEIIKAVWGIASEWFNVNVIQPVATFFSDLWNDIVSITQTCWEGIVNVWNIVSDWFNTYVVTPVATFFVNLWVGIKNAAIIAWDGIKTIAISAWEGIKSVFSTIGSWINEKIVQPVSAFFSGLWDGFKEGARKAWEGVKSIFSTVGTFFKNVFTDAWQGIVKVFSVAGEIFVDIKDGIVSAFKFVVNGIIKGINKVVSIPFGAINDVLATIRDAEFLGLQPFKNLRTINVPQIPLLATGGVVDAGQMFIAREAGPELVGSIGRKTAVANNDQIISGIESGVYRAMVAANSSNSGGGNQTIRIINEIDGDVVGEKVIQYHNGKVMQTGASPLLV
jgi:hypothetical protein